MRRHTTLGTAGSGRLGRWLGWGLLAAGLWAAPARAQYAPVIETDTWSTAGLNGWSDDTKAVETTNAAGYLLYRFPEQASPSPVACTARRAWTNGTTPVQVQFRFRAGEVLPSGLRLCLHSRRSGELWYRPLAPPPTVGEWVQYTVPVEYEAGWTRGPCRSQAEFLADGPAIDWIGVYVRRGGSCRTQTYGVDDFTVVGDRRSAVTVTRPKTGTTVAAGDRLAVMWTGGWPLDLADVELRQGTNRWVLAAGYPSLAPDMTWEGPIPAELYSGDDYAVRVRGTQRPWDYGDSETFRVAGLHVGKPAGAEDRDHDGIDDRWEAKHGMNPDDARDAEEDSDADGMKNREEYVADTDPTNRESVLRLKGLWWRSGRIRLEWDAGTGSLQEVDWVEELGRPWSNVYAKPSGSTASNVLERSATDRGFYRLRATRP